MLVDGVGVGVGVAVTVAVTVAVVVGVGVGVGVVVDGVGAGLVVVGVGVEFEGSGLAFRFGRTTRWMLVPRVSSPVKSDEMGRPVIISNPVMVTIATANTATATSVIRPQW